MARPRLSNKSPALLPAAGARAKAKTTTKVAIVIPKAPNPTKKGPESVQAALKGAKTGSIVAQVSKEETIVVERNLQRLKSSVLHLKRSAVAV